MLLNKAHLNLTFSDGRNPERKALMARRDDEGAVTTP